MSKVETKEISGKDNQAKEAANLLRKAAEACRPYGHGYKGSITVHVYEASFSAQPTFVFATHFAEELPEPLAIEAAKELKVRLMKRYGHEPRRTSH